MHTLHLSPHIENRFSGFTLLFFMLFTTFFIWQLVAYVMSIARLVDMYHFYTYLLRIPDVSPSVLHYTYDV